MSPNKLPQCIHRRVGQILGRKGQGTLKSSFPNPLTQHHHMTSYGPRTVQYSTQGSQQPFQDHQGGHVHPCSGPYPQQKPGEVPASAHMGQSSAGISYTTVQAIQPSSPPTQPLKPPTGSPTIPPPADHIGRGTHTFLVSIHARSNTTPNTPKHP